MQKELDKKNKENEYAHVLKYTGIFGGVQGLNLIASILRNKFAAMLLGPSGLGLVSIYNTTLNLISNSTNFGIPFSSVRNISALYDKDNPEKTAFFIRIVRNWSVWTAILGTLICCCCAYHLSMWTFDNANYSFAFMLLSPIVGMMAVTAGELAILKSIRRLQAVALTSLLGAVASLFISIPLYYFWGIKGIVPSLVLLALFTMGVTLYYSCKFYPFRVSLFSFSDLAKGSSMVRLGVAYILAGILGSGVEYAVRAFMLNNGSLDVVGLYNAGYAVTVTYAGLIFTAMGTDYFPRLSSMNKDSERLNATVNRQIEVSIILVSPMIIAFIIGMSIILPLLYAKTFLPVIGMAKCAAFSIYFRAITLPMEYIPLAKGDSIAYLLLEFIYDVCVVLLIMLGYYHWELLGTGIAISLAGLLNMFIVYLYTRLKYGLYLSKSAIKIFIVQLPFGGIAFMLTFCFEGLLFWVLGGLCLLVSSSLSLKILQQKADLLGYLKSKLKSKKR